MSPDEIQAGIQRAVKVTPAMVFAAKAHLIANASGRTPQMIEAFVADMGATLARPVVIHRSIEPADVIRDVARWLGCQIAAREAVWALIGAGALVPRSVGLEAAELDVDWTTVTPGSGGGHSSGWRFGPAIPVPSQVSLPSSGVTHLTDGDLFLANLDLPDVDSKIAESLREAVTCFRHDLFTPA